MTNFLYLFGAVALVRILISYKNNKKHTEPADQVKNDGQETPVKNWLEHWFNQNNLQFGESDNEDHVNYRSLISLYTCHVELRCFLKKKNGDFGANVMLPFIVDDLYFPAMKKMVSGFNEQHSGFQLYLDKNEGVLHLRIEVTGDALDRMTSDEKTRIFFRMFHLTDQVFKESMGMMYGGTLPEIAVLRMVGMRASMLN